MVWGQIQSVGYSLWLNENQVVSRSGGLAASKSLMLHNVDPVNYDNTPIYAAATITLKTNQVIQGAAVSYTLRDTVKAANDNYQTLTAEQLAFVKAMVAKHPTMKDWEIPNLV